MANNRAPIIELASSDYAPEMENGSGVKFRRVIKQIVRDSRKD